MSKLKRLFQFLGHRGYGNQELHNTLPAFERSKTSKLDGVELDVWLTRDNQPVVVHGDTIFGSVRLAKRANRNKFSSHIIPHLSFAELEGYVQEQTLQKIPHLEEVLDIYEGSDMMINVEIKDPKTISTEVVFDEFRKRDKLEYLYISSFNYFHKHNLRCLSNRHDISLEELPFGYLNDLAQRLEVWNLKKDFTEGDSFVLEFGNVFHQWHMIKGTVLDLKKFGFKFGVYFGCDDIYENKRNYDLLFKEKNVDFLIINYPGYL